MTCHVADVGLRSFFIRVEIDDDCSHGPASRFYTNILYCALKPNGYRLQCELLLVLIYLRFSAMYRYIRHLSFISYNCLKMLTFFKNMFSCPLIPFLSITFTVNQNIFNSCCWQRVHTPTMSTQPILKLVLICRLCIVFSLAGYNFSSVFFK